MHSFTNMPLIPFLFSFSSLINLSIAGYVLKDDYNSAVFFDMFDFWTASDPTHGFVQYIDQNSARKQGLITNSSNVYIGVDHTNITPNGRPSIRLTSKESYNSGSLVILDLAHMPGNACGAWPAYWMVGPDWPNNGEIDIIEGVHLQSSNAMTLHTADGCSLIDNGNFTGDLRTDDCYINAEGQYSNEGCQITTPQTNTYGDGFNNVGGGVYAMEWTDEAITIWFFQRGAIPSNIQRGTPQPDSSWGRPISQFTGCCDIPEFFADNQIVFDVTFCGDWAGSVWSSTASCAALDGSCNSYVANNPSAFKNAYWSINSLQVFEQTVKSSVKVALPESHEQSTSTETSVISVSTASTETASAIESSATFPLSVKTSSAANMSPAAESSSTIETPSAPPAPAETAIETTVVVADYADATTTQWRTLTTTVERVIDTAPTADTTLTQWTTLQTTIAPDVMTTMWTTITSTVEFQKAKRTTLPVALDLEGISAAFDQTSKVEAKPSPSRRWLPRYWGQTRT